MRLDRSKSAQAVDGHNSLASDHLAAAANARDSFFARTAVGLDHLTRSRRPSHPRRRCRRSGTLTRARGRTNRKRIGTDAGRRARRLVMGRRDVRNAVHVEGTIGLPSTSPNTESLSGLCVALRLRPTKAAGRAWAALLGLPAMPRGAWPSLVSDGIDDHPHHLMPGTFLPASPQPRVSATGTRQANAVRQFGGFEAKEIPKTSLFFGHIGCCGLARRWGHSPCLDQVSGTATRLPPALTGLIRHPPGIVSADQAEWHAV
jgi:hypothetical protein